MKPQAGYYRNIIGKVFPMIRIAFTHTQMIGVTKVRNEKVIELLNESNDPFAVYYISGLNNGSMVTIVENQSVDKYFNISELYFKS